MSLEALQDKEYLEKAKLLMFDKNWQDASRILAEAVSLYPQSPHYPYFVFYQGKCLAELKKPKEALGFYEKFIPLSPDESLTEEAQSARIKICFDLYKKGETGYLKTILDLLKHPAQTVRYYAAITLSYDRDKKTAAAALPVLKEILHNETDNQLKDLARIAMLRVDPNSLSAQPNQNPKSPEVRMIKIQITEKGKPEKVFLQVPLFLADLVIHSLDEETKKSMRAKGYQIDQLLKNLSQKTGVIMEIRDGDSHIKIWIE